MGIEPTWDFVEPHAGFEDQERHQAASHLHATTLRRLPRAGAIHFLQAVSQPAFWQTREEISMQIIFGSCRWWD